MRPLRLKVTNYRPFASAEIDLSQVQAAAIIGPNGAGKSTICEAIVNALYGESRSSKVEGPVRLGAENCALELDYSHNGEIYRIIRKRSRSGKADLQYLMRNGKEWNAVGGSGSRDTQARINADLAMDMDLFRVSSCVMQGDSAGLCEATPAKRKDVLYGVFAERLASFAPRHDAAKAEVKRLDTEIARLRQRVEDYEQRIGGKANEESGRANTDAALSNAKGALSDAETRLNAAREAAAAIRSTREKYYDVDQRVESERSALNELAKQLKARQADLAEQEKLLESADAVRAKCKAADEWEAGVTEFAELAERHRELDQQRAKLDSEYDGRIQALRHKAEVLLAERDGIDVTIADRQRRAQLLDDVPCADAPMKGQCKLLADARDAAADIQHLKARAEEIAKQAADAQHQSDTLAEEGNSRLAKISAEIASVGYNAGQHRNAEAKYQELKGYRTLLEQITVASARKSGLEATIDDIKKTGRGRKAALVQLEMEQGKIGRELANIENDPGAQRTLELQAEVDRLKDDVDRNVRMLGVHDERLTQIANAESELRDTKQHLEEVDTERVVMVELQQAYSRNGIPALILDAELAAIEEAANEVLQRLSAGSMRLSFATQRATGRGIAETLDILIEDAAGERPYEDWSGGERLRVDLSVRIAVAQVLARRRGAKIETLILDEVCGALDDAGEDALIQCIQILSNIFDCILLISHRNTIRDRLPQQIVVSKIGDGSEVRLIA